MGVDDLARLGRLHPLVLHLPIGLLSGAFLLEVLALRGRLTRAALTLYLWFAAGSAVLAATSGWILAHETGYGGETLERHERLGIALALAALVAALLHDPKGRSARRLALYRVALGVACVLLVPAGHLGSTLTHGADWLEGPRERRREPRTVPAIESTGSREVAAPASAQSAEPLPANEAPEPETYASIVAPILERYCVSCHGPKKRKGELRLDSPEGILSGGEGGAALVAGEPGQSSFLVRAKLPLEHEDHMPPEGKPQPSAEDLAALAAWISSGAPFGSGAGAAPAEPAVAEEPIGAVVEPKPAARPAPEDVEALRAAFVHVEPLSRDAALLRVDVAAVARSFGDAELVDLVGPLAPFIGELSLARSAITDAGLARIGPLESLRRLDLRATSVTTGALATLARFPALEELNLAQTRLDDAAAEVLLVLGGLRRLFLWNAGLSEPALQRLRARSGLELLAGDEPPAAALESEGELAFSSDRSLPGADLVPEALRPINAACPVSGSPVNPKYALVHTGPSGSRVIGFCCPNCPKEFWADPTRFESKLP
jgi:uncharacterized membrane protein/mono/diheme cytochrome c family protein